MLRFLHIQKTAGSTFTQIIEKLYPTNRFHFVGNPTNDLPRYHALPESEKAAIQLVTGHSPMITGLERIDAMPTVVFFREPVAKVKSFAQHVSEGKSRHLLERFPPAKFSLDKFLWSNVNSSTNWQTRVILGVNNYAPRITENFKEAGQKAFDLALKRGLHIGITEHFDESLKRFAKAFGWKLEPYENRNLKDSSRLLEFEPRHIEKIREMNQADLELYRLASEHFLKTD